MCTVSYIPVRGKVLITSNRDEKNSRSAALAPAFHSGTGVVLLYPTDAEKGGTWIALKENGDAAVLLNGAFEKHQSRPPYRMSRGLLIPEILSAERPTLYLSRMNLEGIEPFTLVIFESGSLFEMRWDGSQQYARQLAAYRPQIWSSATLYDEKIIRKRQQWFASFLNQTPVPTQQDILRFHQFAGEGDPRNDLMMSAAGIYRTVSTTGILLCEGRGSMTYIDHGANKNYEKKIGLTGTILAA